MYVKLLNPYLTSVSTIFGQAYPPLRGTYKFNVKNIMSANHEHWDKILFLHYT